MAALVVACFALAAAAAQDSNAVGGGNSININGGCMRQPPPSVGLAVGDIALTTTPGQLLVTVIGRDGNKVSGEKKVRDPSPQGDDEDGDEATPKSVLLLDVATGQFWSRRTRTGPRAG